MTTQLLPPSFLGRPKFAETVRQWTSSVNHKQQPTRDVASVGNALMRSGRLGARDEQLNLTPTTLIFRYMYNYVYVPPSLPMCAFCDMMLIYIHEYSTMYTIWSVQTIHTCTCNVGFIARHR